MKNIRAFFFVSLLLAPCLYAQDTTLTITGAGNVGIGTTSPTQKLQVAGTVYSTSGGFKFPDGTTQTTAASGGGSGIGGSGSANYLPVFTGSTTLGNSAIYQSLGGNVGIGTIGAFEKLTVQTASGSYGFVHTDGNVIVGSLVNAAAGGFGTKSDHPLYFTTSNGVNGGPFMTIATHGNVGIGTTSPGAPLEISRTTLGNTITAIFGRGSDVNFSLNARQDNSSNSQGTVIGEFGLSYAGATNRAGMRLHRGGSSNDAFLSFTTNAVERVRIDANGNVGIGTTSPGSLLEVNGTGPTTGLRLRNSSTQNYWNMHTETGSGALIFSYNVNYPSVMYAFLSSTSAGLITTSDRRAKRDIKVMEPCLERVMALQPSTFRYNTAEDGTPLNYGFIAQEVETLFPDLVQEHAGLKALAAQGLIAINTQAIQDLKLEKDKQISEMQKEIHELKAMVRSLIAEKSDIGNKSMGELR